MTVAYFDTNALVKLFVPERGSEEMAALWDSAELVVTSRVADAEVRAALAAARRDRRLSPNAHANAMSEWKFYRSGLRVIELTEEIAATAGDLCDQHVLGGLDAIHLASAELFADASLVLATWDQRLLVAAQTRGMTTLPVRL